MKLCVRIMVSALLAMPLAYGCALVATSAFALW